jgi:hypothetical protein
MASSDDNLVVEVDGDRLRWRDELLAEREFWQDRLDYWLALVREWESDNRRDADRRAEDRSEWSDEDRGRDSSLFELLMDAAAFCEARVESRDDETAILGDSKIDELGGRYATGYSDGYQAGLDARKGLVWNVVSAFRRVPPRPSAGR